MDVPEEVCDLNPQKVCQYGTKLAPNLKPVHECTVIPQETCNLKFTPPRTEQKPLISEWCQDDSPPVPDQVGVPAYATTWGATINAVSICFFSNPTPSPLSHSRNL